MHKLKSKKVTVTSRDQLVYHLKDGITTIPFDNYAIIRKWLKDSGYSLLSSKLDGLNFEQQWVKK